MIKQFLLPTFVSVNRGKEREGDFGSAGKGSRLGSKEGERMRERKKGRFGVYGERRRVQDWVRKKGKEGGRVQIYHNSEIKRERKREGSCLGRERPSEGKGERGRYEREGDSPA